MGTSKTADPTVGSSDQIGRLGVMYVRSLLAQAALANQECSPGEDHLAVDMNVEFESASARVQVKCGRSKVRKDNTIGVSTDPTWRRKWAKNKLPVYLIYVRLTPARPPKWVDHEVSHTSIHAHAYWARINGLTTSIVSVPMKNRLTIETFAVWQDHVDRAFRGGGR